MQTITSGEVHRLPPIHSLMTLVLNADYQPLSTWPLSLIPATEAITRLWKKRADTVETWKDAFGEDIVFRSPSTIIAAPKVVALKDYVLISSEPKFSRRSILLRDRFRCQYCGVQFQSNDLTFDHLIPRSKGGKTEWTNIVSACEPCNTEKADKMPGHGGKHPIRKPVRPSNMELLRVGLEFLPEQTKESFGDWLYWTVELEP